MLISFRFIRISLYLYLSIYLSIHSILMRTILESIYEKYLNWEFTHWLMYTIILLLPLVSQKWFCEDTVSYQKLKYVFKKSAFYFDTNILCAIYDFLLKLCWWISLRLTLPSQRFCIRGKTLHGQCILVFRRIIRRPFKLYSNLQGDI